MSSTQHQLIEQCATRLRDIVDALDNIHDTSPHRWSTDLDDVHSSAESLLAMIKCQTADQAAQLLASPPPKCATCGGTGMVDDGEITCSQGGIPYENGPVKCVKDCPDCKAQPSPAQSEQAQHDRIVGALRAEITQLRQHKNDYMDAGQETYRALQNEIRDREAEIARLDGLVSGRTAERDAALANVDALAVQVLKLGGTISFAHHRTDQAGQVPQAWLDVQAERRRQITAEGWTPEHDDEHADGQMAQAAGCYALHAGGIGTDWPDGRQNGAALFWPWDKDSWKPTTPRRDLVKACALALAEIERLDRATATQGGPRDA
ncbi:hypothetical protein [Pseudomonas aeruginosa]|uniref:hypothetical protein n=1 Tax=Pseudomonas aeruginosa TaxID=287 RepID=UPI00104323E0|nr:hypothetical protein [Pseudomonas aeruginosa]